MAFGRAHRIWRASLAGWLLVIASCGSRPLLYGGASGVHSPSGGAGGGGAGSGGAAGAGAGGRTGVSGTGGNTTSGAGGSPSPGSGGGAGGGPGSLAAPRLIAPLSTATVTSQRPTLRWALAAGTDGARVDICRDRACTKPLISFDAAGASGVPPKLLPAGMWFWRAFGKSAGTTGTAVSSTWEMIVGARSAPVDTSWGTTPDVNGDGPADVLVGSIGGDGGAGRAYVYQSGPVGLAKAPSAILSGVEPGAAFGGSLASAGDVNGDGFSDVVVGAIGAAGTGQVYLYLGGPTGISTAPTTTITGGDGFAANFGGAVASAGDVNGDGYADVLVGAYSASNGTGRAYLYWGSATGLATSPAVTLNGLSSGGQFGWAVASAGDTNGDGFADVVIGAPGTANSTGRVYVYLGSAAGLGPSPSTVLFPTETASGYFGSAVAGGGDINGDGFSDVVVGAPNRDSPRTFVFWGSATGLQPAPATRLIPGDTTGSTFGASVANGGDVNGDGFSDVVIGDPSFGPSGVTYLYLGGSSGLGAVPNVTLVGIEDGGNFGNAVATAGDLDGDGLADLVIGASNVGNGTGRVYLYIGDPMAGVSSSPAVTFVGMDVGLSYFGNVVASAERGPCRLRNKALRARAVCRRSRT